MSKIKLSDYIAKRLKEHNVDHFFMVSGGGAMHLNDSLGRAISYTCNHHEQGCAIAAEGYARVNQKLAVVNVTTGPGGLNCLNGVFGQWTDSVPVLYISGQVKYTTSLDCCKNIELRQLGDQEVDIISVVKPLTKYAVTVFEPNEIKYHLDKAIYEATTGRFGPVWLNIPMNVQNAMIEENDLIEFKPSKSKIEYDFKFEEIIEKLEKAKKPIIIAGHGIRLSNQIVTLQKIIAKFNIPTVTTFNGMDLIEEENPLFVGRIGTIGQRAGNIALQNADLILSIGSRNNIRQVSYNWENFGKNAYKIMVDIDKSELIKPLVKWDLCIEADLKDFLPEFLKQNYQNNNFDWLNYCQNLKHKYCFENEKSYKQEPSKPINPYYFTRILTENLEENDIIVMGNGSACVCPFQVGKIKKNQRYILNSGNASMGYDLPASIGAYTAGEGRRTICLAGDGSIMMNLQELETIAYNKLPIKIFILNNFGYSSIKQTQKNFFNGNMTGCDEKSGVGMPNWEILAKGFGLNYLKIECPVNLKEQIKKVLDNNVSVVCEVVLEKEYNFCPKLSAQKLADGTIVSPSLENMAPFY